uniref:Uncharacterized protein n=1 Tax=Trichogramma kaykai TaxID=54128 RepID=A0ABD2X8Z8_9HYME
MHPQNNIKILQWNARRFINKFEFINNAQEYDVIVILESWLKPNHNFHIRGFNTVRYDRPYDKGGGIVILLKNHIIFN